MAAPSAYVSIIVDIAAVIFLLVAAKRDSVWPGVVGPLLWIASSLGFSVVRVLRSNFGWAISTTLLNDWGATVRLLGELPILGASIIIIAEARKHKARKKTP